MNKAFEPLEPDPVNTGVGIGCEKTCFANAHAEGNSFLYFKRRPGLPLSLLGANFETRAS